MRVGVIGCGSIGPVHRAAFVDEPRVAGVVVCDMQADRAEACAQGGAWCTDHRRLLDDPQIGLVSICTPHPSHEALLHEALAAGKHVWCEKPLAVRPDVLARMVAAGEAAARRGLVASGVFQNRFSPLAAELRTLVRTGAFGRLHSASLDFACCRDAAYFAKDAWRGSWSLEGGGVCLNQAIHTVDLWTWMLGPALAVTATCANRWTAAFAEVEDEAEAAVEFDGGLTGRLRIVNQQGAGWKPEIAIAGDEGGFTYSYNRGGTLVTLTHRDPALVRRLRAVEAEVHANVKARMPGKACYGDLHAVQAADVLDAVTTGRPPAVTLAEAEPANALVLGIYHSAAIGARAALPLTTYRQPDLRRPAAAPVIA